MIIAPVDVSVGDTSKVRVEKAKGLVEEVASLTESISSRLASGGQVAPEEWTRLVELFSETDEIPDIAPARFQRELPGLIRDAIAELHENKK